MNCQTNKMVPLAQKGDPYARDILLVQNRSFIKKTASRICNRDLHWNSDMELEIALNAFDEAIDIYSPHKEGKFLSFAREVIYLRIRDYFEKEGKLDSLAVVGGIGEIITRPPQRLQAKDRNKKIASLWTKHEKILKEYGISYEELLGVQEKQPGLWDKLRYGIQSARNLLTKYLNSVNEASG